MIIYIRWSVITLFLVSLFMIGSSIPASASLTGCSADPITPTTSTLSTDPSTTTTVLLTTSVTCSFTSSAQPQSASVNGYLDNGLNGNRTASFGANRLPYTITAGPTNPLDSTHQISGSCTAAPTNTSCSITFTGAIQPTLNLPAPLSYPAGTYTETFTFVITQTTGSVQVQIQSRPHK